MKSLSVRPSILWVKIFTATRPQPSSMSGWCACSSARAPTRFTKSSASLKFPMRNSLSRWCSSTTLHSGTCRDSSSSSVPLSGGTSPLHGTHVLAASSAIPRLLWLLFPPRILSHTWPRDAASPAPGEIRAYEDDGAAKELARTEALVEEDDPRGGPGRGY